MNPEITVLSSRSALSFQPGPGPGLAVGSSLVPPPVGAPRFALGTHAPAALIASPVVIPFSFWGDAL